MLIDADRVWFFKTMGPPDRLASEDLARIYGDRLHHPDPAEVTP